MKHIQQFNSHSKFESVLSTLPEPWVAMDDEHVHFMSEHVVESDPVEFVDLGLPSGLLWASCNIGATSPEEYGKYFQWGETEGAYENEEYSIREYNGRTYYEEKGLNPSEMLSETGILKSEYDAATVIYGTDYRMPTTKEIQELFTNTNCEYIEENNITGYRFTSNQEKNLNSIFIISNRARIDDKTFDLQKGYALLWSSQFNRGYAQTLSIISSDKHIGGNYPYAGMQIRAVKEPKQ